ncbi:unnamed protein product [Leuciscus chuanchicus]
MATLPESSNKMEALPESLNKMAATPESAPDDTVLIIMATAILSVWAAHTSTPQHDPRAKMAATVPEPSDKMAAAIPEPSDKIASIPEPSNKIAAFPEPSDKMAAVPEPSDKMAASTPVSSDKMAASTPVSSDKMAASKPVSSDKMAASTPVSSNKMADSMPVSMPVSSDKMGASAPDQPVPPWPPEASDPPWPPEPLATAQPWPPSLPRSPVFPPLHGPGPPSRPLVRLRSAWTPYCVYGSAPVYLKDLINRQNPTRHLRSSDSHQLQVPKSKLRTMGDRAFQVAVPRLLNKPNKPASPGPSHVSLRNESLSRLLTLKEKTAQHRLINREDSDFSLPSGLSMKSEQSMKQPIHTELKHAPNSQQQIHRTDSDFSLPSGLSMKSGQSMDDPKNFSREPILTELNLNKPKEHAEPSQVSLGNQSSPLYFKKEIPEHKLIHHKQSMDDPNNFRREPILTELTTQQKELRSNVLNEDLIWTCKIKRMLRNRCQCIFEGNEEHSSPSLLDNVYTELYITDVGSSEHSREHEIRQIEMVSKHPATIDAPIKANDIFKAFPRSTKQILTVLTKGIAGIGKTVSVKKFTLDWVEERANRDVQMIFPLPFREMNGFKERKTSLIHILQRFFNLKIDAEVLHSDKYKIVFIFDGLDECRFPLDFQNNRSCSSVTESVSIGVLLTNLICKNLLPSALVWITSRPAATGQIPLDFIDRVTEVRGFNDSHKEEYFIKKIGDPDLSSRIISHLKSSKILHIMCHIPVFCWISATVLENMFRDSDGGEIPRTLTQMYAHFLIFQIKQGSHKYDGISEEGLKLENQTTLLLGKLAFKQLEKGNLLFYEEDLKECGIELNVASVYSGVCTQIFREEAGLLQERVFSFVHASMQEFLAALYAFLVFVNKQRNVLSQTTNAKIISTLKKLSVHEFLKCAVDKALASDNGHLDLFLRFLLGLSLESNQTLLQELRLELLSDAESNMKTLQYIKEKIRDHPSAEKAISLFHCLSELKDDSLVEEVQEFINSQGFCGGKLSPSRFSALAYILLTSAEELDVFDLAKFIHPSMTSNEGVLRLLPVIKASRSVL